MRYLLVIILATSAHAQSRIITLEAPMSLTTTSVPAGPVSTAGITIRSSPPEPRARLPRDCDRCGKSRPVIYSPTWEREHALAHHVTDVLIRTEGRRITTDAGDMRGVVMLLKTQIKALKLADPKSMAWEVADEAIKTLEIVVLRLENVEGELKREREQKQGP